MGTGIVICGMNGAGKSTVGEALAKKLSFHFIDSERLYFPGTDSPNIYATSRRREDAGEILLQEIRMYPDFVFASVKGDYGEEFYSFVRYVVLIDAPENVRLRRIRERSFRKFGNRMLPDGELYEQEERFFEFVKSRKNVAEEWVRSVDLPVIRVDGTKSVSENVTYIAQWMSGMKDGSNMGTLPDCGQAKWNTPPC